ncbi:AbrB family transcriptional regulator [Arsenicicoccus sp. oral taxon 190]|uniref:AbrB family transcriptional regulator n=1 Tax=Arsenicicoccus sp. oral taxon 190 TaxID=1658671 RepID=UPI00067A34CA|nr:AbrB family transcriptional regulator [Arsenicicoccus sp. oral taxon 190]AKT51250.1 hypothetical protein ADJ73_07880 [Arsenicicoccus sp. oral taxon 190]
MITPPARVLAAGVAVGAAVWVCLALLALPSPSLFGGLAAGAVLAFGSPRPPELPRWGMVVAQALVGVTIGETVTLAALRQIAADWPSVLVVTVVTLLLSLLAGAILARLHPISLATGLFSMAAGGASGITSIADELGADARVVSILQYLRVLLVLVTLPLVVGLAFHPQTGQAVAAGGARAGLGASLGFVAVSVVVGLALARLVPVSTFTLIGPLAVAGAIALWGGLGVVRTPGLLVALAMLAIGLQVGVKFTRDSVRAIGRMLPAGLVLIAALLVLCGALGWVLSWVTGVDPLTTYLATTPGGLFAVLATAADSGAEPTYVFAVQLARLLAILALAPVLARWLRTRRG